MTSREVHQMYLAFSEMITARRFASNTFYLQNDAIAIMEYSDAFTVLDTNLQAQGICLTNIAHIYYRNKDYKKAETNYKGAAL